VAIADVFDALTSKRPYKEPFTIEKSWPSLKKKGNHFDPDVVDAFFDIQDEILNIKKQYSEDNQKIIELPNLEALLIQYNLSDANTAVNEPYKEDRA